MSAPVVIDNESPAVTRDWRDTFRDATDIANIGPTALCPAESMNCRSATETVHSDVSLR